MRLAWLTDLHLNFLDEPQIEKFFAAVLHQQPDAIVISGDIGEAFSVPSFLLMMEQRWQRPVYFVLGNHDYYYGSLRAVRQAVERLSHEAHWLTWLTRAGIVQLTPTVGLVGHGAWADGRCGNYTQSPVIMNDYLLIDEFSGLHRDARRQVMRTLGDEAADYFRAVLPVAFRKYKRILLATHVPPFREACWHEGKISDEHYLPHYVCQAAGDALCEVMSGQPDSELVVLCGHSHGTGRARILPNLIVLTGGAVYGHPGIQQVFELAHDPVVVP